MYMYVCILEFLVMQNLPMYNLLVSPSVFVCKIVSKKPLQLTFGHTEVAGQDFSLLSV